MNELINYEYLEHLLEQEKNLILKVIRGISFDDVIDAVEQGRELDNFKHLKRRKSTS